MNVTEVEIKNPDYSPEWEAAMCAQYERAVMKYATSYHPRLYPESTGLEVDDLVGRGYFGVIYACRTYDPRRAKKFSTHAINCIRWSILRAPFDGGGLIYVPMHRVQSEGGWPFILSVSPADAEALRPGEIPEELLAAPPPCGSSPEERADAARLVAALPERERRVISAHVYGGKAFAEIARADGVTRQRIQQIYNKGVMRMRRALGAEDGQ